MKRVLILAFLIMLSLQRLSLAQAPQLFIPSINPNQNNLNFGADKIVDTYYFNCNSIIGYESLGGKFFISQIYKGAALTSINTLFRDDEQFNFQYYLPLNKTFWISASNNWLLSAIKPTTGIDRLENISGGLGMRINLEENSFFDIKAGVEQNDQAGIKSTDFFFNGAGILSNHNWEGYLVNSQISGEYIRLSLDRLNTDLDARANLTKQFDSENRIGFDFRYKKMKRDMLLLLGSTNMSDINVESRNEDLFDAALSLDFKLWSIFSGIRLGMNGASINRSYRNYQPALLSSGVERSNTKFDLSSAGFIRYMSQNYNQSIELSFESKSDEYDISKKFDISKDTEISLRDQEKQMDNSESIVKLTTQSTFIPGINDTIAINLNFKKTQYDTPSDKNDGDNDFFQSITQINYSHRFSSIFKSLITFDLQQTHLVYLKASHSSANRWNRVLRLAPGFVYNTKYLSMKPTFELLANYTVYDFNYIQSNGSYSKRQISYVDSIMINLKKSINLQTTVVIRYFENGTLYWDTFSEKPQNSNYERFLRSLLNFETGKGTIFGIGFRYYSLDEKNLFNSSGNNRLSIGPETMIKISFNSGSELSFKGWYEFQYINNMKARGFPNIFLKTKINI
ncbi:MAG: hypothetical protein QG635_505 [Bacteroidota bacterium]|nr:hypothetical protein [Bacteroidota bacterium]